MTLRFLCDHDVDADVAAALRRLGHEAWTAAEAGLHLAGDDDLTVYADNKQAVLVSHDIEFSKRRRRNVVGRHIWLRCPEWEAANLIVSSIEELLPLLRARRDLWIKVGADGTVELSFEWK